MSVVRNKSGMYEYILTKTIMLFFIIGLVGIFFNMLSNIHQTSAQVIINEEARRIARKIDDAISFKGVSNTVIVNLKTQLTVGRDTIPYTFRIDKDANIFLTFVQYPYMNITGYAKFGLNLVKDPDSKDEILCNWYQISNQASLNVSKDSSWIYVTSVASTTSHPEGIYYVVHVRIDASKDCLSMMKFSSETPE